MPGPGYTPKVDPQLGGSAPLEALTALLNPLLAGQGLLPGQFNPTQNYYDRLHGGQYSQGMNWAIQQGSQQDRLTYLRLMRGMGTLTGRSWTSEQEKAAQAAADDMVKMGPMLAQLAPQTFDALHGSRGSSQVMSMNVFDASRFIRDPHTGRTGLAANQAAWLNNQLYSGLYGPNANLSQMNGMGAGQTGMMFKEMTQRGMVGGHDMMTGPGMERTKDRLKQMSGAVRAMQDIFGESGRGDAPMQEIFAALDKVTQGNLSNMSPGQIQGIVRRMHALSHLTGSTMGEMTAMSDRGAAMAQSVGLDRQFGISTATSSSAFGQGWTNMTGPQGFGGLNRESATALDQRLRTAAAGSATANRMGATVKMAEAELIPGLNLSTEGFDHQDPAVREAAQRRYAANQTKLQGLIKQSGNMTPQQWQSFMQSQGVTGGVASNFLASREANQEAILRYGLQDQVREAQGMEVGKLMSNVLGGGSRATLRRMNMNPQASAQASRIIGDTIRDTLVGMNPEYLADPTKAGERNNFIRQRVQAALRARGINLPDAAVNEIVANSLQSLDQRIRSDPNLKQFGNISGLISMNRGDVLQQGRGNLQAADQAAEQASRTAGIGQAPPIARASDAIQNAKPGDTIGSLLGNILGGVDPERIKKALGGAVPGGTMPPDNPGSWKDRWGSDRSKEPSPTETGKVSGKLDDLNITGTLTINADNTATLNGTSRPGNVTSPT